MNRGSFRELFFRKYFESKYDEEQTQKVDELLKEIQNEGWKGESIIKNSANLAIDFEKDDWMKECRVLAFSLINPVNRSWLVN